MVTSVQEVYLDYQAITPQLYTLDIPSVVTLCSRPPHRWGLVETTTFERMADGLMSLLLSVRGGNPKIRYDEGSNIC